LSRPLYIDGLSARHNNFKVDTALRALKMDHFGEVELLADC